MSGEQGVEIEVSTRSLPAGRPLRFAARAGDLRSRSWMLVAAKTTADLYVVPDRMSKFLHFSLHEDDAHWHYKVSVGRDEVTQNWRPLPGVDGARLALTIDFRLGSLQLPVDEAADEVDMWIGGNIEQGSLLVELFLLDGDLPSVRPAGQDAVLCGGVRMSDGRAAALVASDAPGSPLPSTRLPLPEGMTREQLRALASSRHLGAMLFRTGRNGSLIITDSRAARPGG